jgi:hypothetical protein
MLVPSGPNGWRRTRSDARRGHAAATEKFGVAVADFLLSVHLPELPPPTDIVAYALDLECGHDALQLAKRGDIPKPAPEQATPRLLVVPAERRPKRRPLRRAWSTPAPARGARPDTVVGRACLRPLRRSVSRRRRRPCRRLPCVPDLRGDDPDFDVEIIALGERLPDRMVQDWTVELDCGHTGTDHFIPVDHRDDPAGHRAEHPRRTGLRCINEACDQRQVPGTRRLGVLGKIRIPPSPPPDPVTAAARDLRRRLSKHERQALIRELQDDG